MRKFLFTAITFLVAHITLLAQADKVIARNPEVITGKLIKVTEPLSTFKMPAGWVDVPVRDENGRIFPDGKKPVPFEVSTYPQQQQSVDPSIQSKYNTEPRTVTNRAVVANFNGLGYSSVNPPDPTLCVGPNHVIQMINGNSGAYFKVFNKTGGQVVAQTFLDQVTGRGGLGDPIALYDQFADRFVLLEFANKSENANTEGLIIAVSQTNNPAGSWYVYFFGFGSTFPDYPKMSIWNDAYYCTTNDFANASSYTGSSAWAFNRADMIAGNATAQSQRFTLGSTSKHFSMCPVLLQGTTTPPAGTGGLIAYMADDAWTSSTADVDSIGMFEFKVNFATPSLTTITTKSSLATAAYKSDICTATRGQCITQPGTTVKVEALHQKIQNQPVYRRFAGYEGIVVTHAVDKGANIAGVRWYELRKTTGNWSIYQQSTYAPDNTNRFLPSVCYDSYGNIGLAYNVSSSATSVYPGARYTGRKECDALNTLTYTEDVLIAGTASNASTRYGDYNHLVCDPDGVTFWFTCEYNAASTWSTRISSFTLDPCTPPVCGDPTSLASSAITNTSATVNWTAVASALSYDVDYKLTSASIWTNAATATTTTSVNIAGLTQGTTYNWRVRATCTGGSGNYVAAQFTTTAPCGIPTGLTSSGITSSTATVSWAAVSGATSYAVDYKLNSSSTWNVATASTASTSVNLSGLSASSLYNWRVRATCASGTSVFGTAQFTTTAASTCGTAFEPNETQATAAAISSGATNSAAITTTTDIDYYKIITTATSNNVYNLVGPSGVDYDLYIYNSAGTQIGSGTGATATETITLNNQVAGTYYIKVIGYNGANSATCYTIKATATTVTSCQSSYDVSTNGTISGAATIPFNTNITGLISPSGDIDNNKFVITTGGTITLTLTTLPADYDLKLLNSAGTQVAISQNGSTTSETISYTAVAGTYYAQVYGYSGANNATVCYTLKVQLGTATSPEPVILYSGKVKMNLYPNPVNQLLNVSISGYNEIKTIEIFDLNGNLLITEKVMQNNTALHTSKLSSGIYFIKVTAKDGTVLSQNQFVKE